MKSVSKRIIVFLILLIILLPFQSSAIKLSSMGDDEEDSLSQYMRKPYESDIESARRPAPEIIPERAITGNQNINRPASENKSPMQADNLWDMELPYWDSFEFSPWNYAEYDIPNFMNPPAIVGYAQPGLPTFRYPEEAADPEKPPLAYGVGCALSCPTIRAGGWGEKCTDPYT